MQRRRKKLKQIRGIERKCVNVVGKRNNGENPFAYLMFEILSSI